MDSPNPTTPTTNPELQNSSNTLTSTTPPPSIELSLSKPSISPALNANSPEEQAARKRQWHEEPLANLLGAPFDQMEDEEIRTVMKRIKTLQASPQTLAAHLREESVVLEKKVSKRKKTAAALIADLD